MASKSNTSRKRSAVKTVAEYISACPVAVRPKLEKIRATIRRAAPEAEESISYGIPTYKLNGVLIYFAAHTNHIGLYPAPREADEFREELADYQGGKGTVQFPLEKPIPLRLIGRIVKYRAQSNLARAKAKRSKR